MRSIATATCASRRALILLFVLSISIGVVAEGARHLSPADLNEKLLSSTSSQTRSKPVKRRRSQSSVLQRVLVVPLSKQSTASQQQLSAKATIASVLVALCPRGVLLIAFGMAAAGDKGRLLPCALLIFFGLLAWYSLISLARAAEVVLVRQRSSIMKNDDHQSTLAAVWGRTIPNGGATTFVPDIACVCLTAGNLLVSSAFMGDLFVALTSNIDVLPLMLKKRWVLVLLLHGIFVIPLCLHIGSASLGFVTLPGLVGVLYTVFFVVKRFIDKSYHLGGAFFDLALSYQSQPSPQSDIRPLGHDNVLSLASSLPRLRFDSGLLALMNMCCLAYGCHYNGVKYYMELKNRTVPVLQTTMALGIGASALVFVTFVVIAHLTFGENSSSLFLNNYQTSRDSLAAMASLLTGLALISSYPLAFDGMKSSLFSLYKFGHKNIGDDRRQRLSISLLLLITFTACFVTEHRIGSVIVFVGSVFGSVIMYVFPALVNNSLLKMRDRNGNALIDPFFRGESVFNQGLFAFGVVFAALGSKIFTSPTEEYFL